MHPQHSRPLSGGPPQRFSQNGPPFRDEHRSSYGDFIDRQACPPLMNSDWRDVRFRGDYLGALGSEQRPFTQNQQRNDISPLLGAQHSIDTWRERDVGYYHGPPNHERHPNNLAGNGAAIRNGPYPPRDMDFGGGWRNEPPRFENRPRSRSPIDSRSYRNPELDRQHNSPRNMIPPRTNTSDNRRERFQSTPKPDSQSQDERKVPAVSKPSVEKRKSLKELKEEEIEKAAQTQIAMMAELEAKAREKEENEKKVKNDAETGHKEAEAEPSPIRKQNEFASSSLIDAKHGTIESPLESSSVAKMEMDINIKKKNENFTTEEKQSTPKHESPSKPIIISNAKFEDVHLFHLTESRTSNTMNQKAERNSLLGASGSKPKPYADESWFKQYQNRTSQLKASASAQRPPPFGAFPPRPAPYHPPSSGIPRNGPVYSSSVSQSMGSSDHQRAPLFFGNSSNVRGAAPVRHDVPATSYAGRGPLPPLSRDETDRYVPPIPRRQQPPAYPETAFASETESTAAPSRYRNDNSISENKDSLLPTHGTGREVLDPTAYVEELSDMGDDWNEVVALLKDSPKPQRTTPGGYPTSDRPRKPGLLGGPPPAPAPVEKSFFRNDLPSTQQRIAFTNPHYAASPEFARSAATTAPDRGVRSLAAATVAIPQARIAPAAPVGSSRPSLLRHADAHGSRWKHEGDRRGPPRDSWDDRPDFRGPPGSSGPPGWQNEYPPRGRPYQY